MQFEEEVLFPTDPYEAAIIFFALMAYPEKGAGEIGNAGSKFANALAQFLLWSCRKSYGLAYLRDKRQDPTFTAPRKRDFSGTLERGVRRIDRRIAAYGVYGTQLFHGFFAVRALGAKAIAEGREDQAFHLNPAGYSPVRAELWERGMPSVRKIIDLAPQHWADKLRLNQTGNPADIAQKSKDDYGRAYIPSIPVLNLVHAYSHCATEYGPKIGGWKQRDPICALLMNAEIWIWDALKVAEEWRQAPRFPGSNLSERSFVKIIRTA